MAKKEQACVTALEVFELLMSQLTFVRSMRMGIIYIAHVSVVKLGGLISHLTDNLYLMGHHTDSTVSNRVYIYSTRQKK